MKELWNRLDDAFEQTPEDFHTLMERRLDELSRSGAAGKKAKRSYRRVVALAACAVLLCGAAVAAGRLGVLDFLTTRIEGGPDRAAVETGVSQPQTQRLDADMVKADVRDIYRDGDTLGVCVHIAPADESAYALLSETDIGVDGERFDRIWWKGEILTFDEWLPEGKQMLVLSVKGMTVDGKRALASYDYVPEDQGETFYFEADLSRLAAEPGKEGADGPLTVEIQLETRVYGTDEVEASSLRATLGGERQPR